MIKQKKQLSFIHENFFQLLEESQDVFYLRRAEDSSLLYVNAAFEKMWCVVRQDIYNNNLLWYDSIHPNDKEYYAAEIKRILRNPQAKIDYIYYHLNLPNFSVRRIQECVIPLYEKGRILAYAGLVQDVTLNKLHLAQFEQAMYFFQFFAEKAHFAFWVHDYTLNKQLYISPGYRKIWGREINELYHNPDSWMNSIHPDDRAEVAKVMRFRTLNEDNPNAECEYRYRILLPNGDMRWIKDTSFPIHDERRSCIGFAGMAEDITREVLYAEELQQARQRAELANHAKSDFLAMVSHELRTPLNAILGMAQILRTQGLSDESNEYIDNISQAGRNLLALVNDILDFARIEAGKLNFAVEPFNLSELLEQSVQSMQFQAKEKGLQLSLKNEVTLDTLIGDLNRIRQVLINFLSNAIKFTEQGSVTLIARALQRDHDRILIQFIVQDTGIGMTPDEIQIIFKKFSQVDSIYHRKQSGIGLGLAITKELVHAMGGDIQVSSEVGKGSIFQVNMWIKLKLAIDKEAPVFKNESLQDGLQKRYPFHLLLVEDNLINQKVAKVMLESFGCTVTILSDGKQVIENMDKLPEYDMILMDVGLPDMSGYDIVSHLRKEPKLKDKPIIALTAHILDRDRERAFQAGMNKIVAKPISYEVIAEMLQEYTPLLESKIDTF